MDTALAQDLDLQPCTDEAGYWRIIDGKTPPLFECALAMGARLGGADASTADAIGALGRPLGRMIQISDDLRDVLETPVSADWSRPRNNLASLYAMTAPHDQRERFVELVEQVTRSPAALAEAQAIIFPSGAGSYCVVRIIEAYRTAMDQLEALELADPQPLRALLQRPIPAVLGMLASCGVEEPQRLLHAALEAA